MNNKFVCQLPLFLQWEIERRLHNRLSQDYEGDELNQLVADGMNSRVGDLEDVLYE
jgi:hypothetical protein